MLVDGLGERDLNPLLLLLVRPLTDIDLLLLVCRYLEVDELIE